MSGAVRALTVCLALAASGCHAPPAKAPRVFGPSSPSVTSALAVGRALPPDFEPSSWRFLQVEGVRPEPAENGTEPPSLAFLQGTLSGSTGCNRLLGDYRLDDPHIAISNLAATRRFCEGRMDLESRILSVLQRTRSVVVIRETGLLGLVGEDNTLMAELERLPDPAPKSP